MTVWVWLHGWGSDSRVWHSLQRQLPGEHVCLDLPGCGSASRQICETLDECIDFLGAQLPPKAIVVGWSLGGMLAVRLAAAYPERIEALVTVASNACFVARDSWPWAMDPHTFTNFTEDFSAQPLATWTRFCALQAMADRHRKAVATSLRQLPPPQAQTLTAWQNGLRWLAELDNRTCLASMPIPRLHVLGQGDALVPAVVADHLDRHPAASIEVLQGVGHALPISAPERLADLFRAWLAKNPIDAASAHYIPKYKIAQSFGRAAPVYDLHAHVQKTLAQHLVDFCEVPQQGALLDLGCGTGFVARLLKAQIAVENLYLMDIAEPMLHEARAQTPELRQLVTGDAESLPFADQTFHAVISSLAMQWCPDLRQLGREIARVLVPSGVFALATLGPATLMELKQAWSQVDSHQHVNDFPSLDALVASLAEAGLTVESIKHYEHRVYYRELMTLLRELKAIGAHNMNARQKSGMTSRNQLRALETAYSRWRNADGLLPATYDVLLIQLRKQ